ncbi:hypothetical protein Tco_0477775, partial [Tanacetum coccineum]
MAFVFLGFALIPFDVTMYPKNLPSSTPNSKPFCCGILLHVYCFQIFECFCNVRQEILLLFAFDIHVITYCFRASRETLVHLETHDCHSTCHTGLEILRLVLNGRTIPALTYSATSLVTASLFSREKGPPFLADRFQRRVYIEGVLYDPSRHPGHVSRSALHLAVLPHGSPVASPSVFVFLLEVCILVISFARVTRVAIPLRSGELFIEWIVDGCFIIVSLVVSSLATSVVSVISSGRWKGQSLMDISWSCRKGQATMNVPRLSWWEFRAGIRFFRSDKFIHPSHHFINGFGNVPFNLLFCEREGGPSCLVRRPSLLQMVPSFSLSCSVQQKNDGSLEDFQLTVDAERSKLKATLRALKHKKQMLQKNDWSLEDFQLTVDAD